MQVSLSPSLLLEAELILPAGDLSPGGALLRREVANVGPERLETMPSQRDFPPRLFCVFLPQIADISHSFVTGGDGWGQRSVGQMTDAATAVNVNETAQ